jgi:phosphatidylglycerophosphate synthase
VTYDGIVSRYLNRPISRPIARLLRPTPITPNAVTIFTLLLSVVAGLLTAAGWNIAGGVLIQAVSVVDGVDGELARLKNMSTRLGAVLDALTDRYADVIMIGGMTVYAVRFENHGQPELAGMLAALAALTVSYSRARIEASLQVAPSDGIFGIASRDVRSLVAAIGTVAGQCYWTLWLLAVLSFATVAWRLVYLRAKSEERRAESREGEGGSKISGGPGDGPAT